MTESLLGVVFFIGPLLGAACYVLGPLCSAAAALVHVKPWWLSPGVGLVAVPAATLLFTPVCAFCSKLPLPMPWLLAAAVDGSSATSEALWTHGRTLAAIYLVVLALALSARGVRHAWRTRTSSAPHKQSERG